MSLRTGSAAGTGCGPRCPAPGLCPTALSPAGCGMAEGTGGFGAAPLKGS